MKSKLHYVKLHILETILPLVFPSNGEKEKNYSYLFITGVQEIDLYNLRCKLA